MKNDEWDDHAVGWDANSDVRIFAEKAFETLNREIASALLNLADSRILDFGCGTGLLSEKLAPTCGHIVAVDTSAVMIDVLKRKIVAKGIENITPLRTTIDAATVDEFPEFANKFDLIVASSVCNFLPDYEATLRCLSSMLRPGGCFVQWDWLADMPIARIRRAYEAAGLSIIRIEEAFAMEMKDESRPVVMGLAQSPV